MAQSPPRWSAARPPVSGDSIYYLATFRADQGRTAEAQRLLDVLLSRDVPGFYRQEAQALFTRLGEPAESETPRLRRRRDDAESSDKTKASADAVDKTTPATDAKKPAQP